MVENVQIMVTNALKIEQGTICVVVKKEGGWNTHS